MKVIVIVKGKRLDIEHFWCCEKVSVKGVVKLVTFIDQNLNRHIRHVEDKCIIDFFGKDLELVTKSRDMLVLSGDVTKYFIYDKHGRIGVIHYLTPSEFK